jgi:hypothetical protein
MRAVKRFAEERIFILRVHDHRTLVMRGGEGLLRYTRRGSARSSSPTRNRLRRATKQVRSDAARASLLIIISEILRDDSKRSIKRNMKSRGWEGGGGRGRREGGWEERRR